MLWFGFGFYIAVMSSAFCWQEGCVSPDMYSDSEESGSGSEEEADDDESYEDDEDDEDDECDDESQGSDEDDDYEESGTGSEGGHSVKSDDDKVCSCTFLDWNFYLYLVRKL